jgi:hypothetical protein
MTIGEMLRGWLVEHGFDGLCNSEFECGCGLDDLFPCESCFDDCEPAYLVEAEPGAGVDLWFVTKKPTAVGEGE